MYLFCGSKARFGTTPVAMKLLFSRINEERKLEIHEKKSEAFQIM